MLENTQNSICDCAEELVSYLYDEMSGTDKLRFEKHLKTCSSCQDELAGFSLTRTSIQEWHKEDFLPLQSPSIEINYPQKIETISRSWFASIRDFFTLSPAWMTASTAFAALAICAVLLAVVVSSLRDDRTVARQNEKGNTNIVSSPTNGNQNQNSNVSNANQNKQKPANLSEPPVLEKVQKPSRTNPEPTKISVQPTITKQENSSVKTVLPTKQKDLKEKLPKNNKKEKAPSFLDDDEEEDSLTLTDLLEQIGAREIDD